MNKDVTRLVTRYAVSLALIFVARLLDKAISGWLPINAAILTNTAVFSCILISPSLIGGLIMGFMYGAVSLIATLMLGGTPDFLNPLVSVVPRMIVGVAVYGAFYGVHKLMRGIGPCGKEKSVLPFTVAAVAAGVVGSLTNTVTVLGMINLINMNGDWFSAVLSTIIAVNGVLEITVPPALTPIIALGVRRGLNIKDKFSAVNTVAKENLQEDGESK